MDILTLSIGICSLIVSIFAIVVIVLVKTSIRNILDKGTILFDENFVVKKDVLTNALNLVDDISIFGKKIVVDNAFARKSRDCYNNLICVVNNSKIIKEFENIAINPNIEISAFDIESFKIECRLEIGLKAKRLKKK